MAVQKVYNVTIDLTRKNDSIEASGVTSFVTQVTSIGILAGPQGPAGTPATLIDATDIIKGVLQLNGDLGGSADTPLIKRTTRFIVAPHGDSRPCDFRASAANTDASAVIAAQAAAHALPGGADVELLDGTFVFEQAVFRLPNVHIYGQGMGHTKVTTVAGANFNIFDLDKVTYNQNNPLDNAVIADMEIDGSNLASTSEKKCINGGNFTNSHIYRIYAHDSTATGIGDDDFYGTTIEGCLVVNCGYENKRTITSATYASNTFTFGTSAAHGYTAWAAASSTLTSTGAINNNDTVTLGGLIYTFKTTLTGAAFEVLINGSAANALVNLQKAIKLSGTAGTDYGLGTNKHPSITAGTPTSTTLPVSSINYGTSGNGLVTTETGANISFSSSTLTGGITGNKIVITGMVPVLWNGTFNVTGVTDSTHFTINSTNNSGGLNFTLNPGAPTNYGITSDSLIGHNGIGIASGSLNAETCIVSNCICIGNNNNNFLIEADYTGTANNAAYIFSNCISINAGSCGYRNTGSINAQFNNCFDYGSPIGGEAISVFSNRTIIAASWSGGVATFQTSTNYLFTVGKKIQITGMAPEAYNGYYTVDSTPDSTHFTVAIASDPGTSLVMGSAVYEVHPVDGSSFNNPIFTDNLNIGLYLPNDGVIANSPTIKNCYNYGAQISSASFCRIQECRIYNNGRQGIYIVMGGGIYEPMDHVTITGHVYNNGQRFANMDGIDVDPSTTSAPIKNLSLDVHAFDTQETKTQRYGIILRSGGTITNTSVKGNLSSNATAPILVQNTSDSIYVDNVIGVNPRGRVTLGNITGTPTFDVSTGDLFFATLTGNITPVMTTPAVIGAKMTWILTQDGTGSRTITLPTNAAAGTTLTLSTTAAAIDIVSWVYDGTKWRLSGRSLANTSVGTLSSLVVTTPNAGNTVAATITQNDTTNNPNAQNVTNAGTSHGQLITQSGILAANKYGLFVDSSAAQVNAPLVRFRQNNASTTSDTLQLDNTGTGNSLFLNTGPLKLSGGVNIIFGSSTGTQIGVNTTGKLAFYGATPIIQPTGNVLTAITNLGLVATPTIAEADVTNLTTDLAAKAVLASPTFTGTPAAPTATAGTNTTQLATTAFTQTARLPRINTTASSATPSINTDTTDQFNITALAAAITSMTTNLTGTPTDGQKLTIRIKDNGTARAITWGASFANSGVASMPTTTVISKTHLVGFIYDSVAVVWVCVASDTVGY